MTTISPSRIAALLARREELSVQLASGDLPREQFVAASKEYAELDPVADAAGELQGDADAMDNRNRRRRARMGARGVRTGRADDVTLPELAPAPASSVVAGGASRQVRTRRRHGRKSA